MENTFFHTVFSTLSNAECKLFAKFVASPYFTGRVYLTALLEYFIECRWQDRLPKIENAWSSMAPDEPFDDQRWRLALSNLLKLLEQFLSQQEMGIEPGLHRQYLAQAYRKRGLSQQYLRNLSAWQKEWKNQEQRSTDSYENLFRLELEHYRFLSSDKQPESLNMQEMSDAIDAVFIARKLRHACFSFSHQTVFSTDYKIAMLEEVIHLVESTPALLQNPSINLFYHCYQALIVGSTSDSPESRAASFQQFQQLLFDHGSKLHNDEQRSLLLLAINYGIRQINTSRPEYDRPVLNLYRMGLDSELLLENGMLSRFAYNNIAAIALRLNELEWTEHFINKYKLALERQHRGITFSMNLARLEYARKNYREALVQLQRSDYRHPVNNLLAKTLQMKIFYETGEFDTLEHHLHNMKTYLRRQRKFGYHKDNFLNIINFTKSLVASNPFDKQAIEALTHQIAKTEPLTERKWLLEMAVKI